MTNNHTMPKAKIAITIDTTIVRRLDALVAAGTHGSRSEAIERAVWEYVARRERSRLARECEKLDPSAERALADEGLTGDAAEWPAY
jgi:Arc/MetJ-type ribon-helix-helix transcriptional regulator